MSVKHIGKRIKSNKDLVMFRRFPNSDMIETLPAGKPSPLIDSFLANGFYQLRSEDEKLYLKKTADTKIVDENEPDNSGFFSGITTSVSDWFTNTGKEVSDQAGFLSDGFSDSVGSLKTDIFDFNKTLTPIIWGLVALLGLYIINKITQ